MARASDLMSSVMGKIHKISVRRDMKVRGVSVFFVGCLVGLMQVSGLCAMEPGSDRPVTIPAVSATVLAEEDAEKEQGEAEALAAKEAALRDETHVKDATIGMMMLATEAVSRSTSMRGLPFEQLTKESGRVMVHATMLLNSIQPMESFVHSWIIGQESVVFLTDEEAKIAVKSLDQTDIALNSVMRGLVQSKIDRFTKKITAQLQKTADEDEPLLRLLISVLSQDTTKPWRRGIVKSLQRSLEDLNETNIMREVIAMRVNFELGVDCDRAYGQEKLTPLSAAVLAGNSTLVELLLEKKATTDLANVMGTTPLMSAVQGGREDMVTTLILVGGANPDLKDMQGRSARDMASEDMRAVIEAACAMRSEMRIQDFAGQEEEKHPESTQEDQPA